MWRIISSALTTTTTSSPIYKSSSLRDILGIITALFSLAGTSKVFGWMRYLVGGGEGTAIVTLWSIYYLILLFILPLAVAFLIFLIREVGEDAGERGMWIWKKKELWWINSVIAIIAVVLGIILLII
mgnify:CR=1 FL=1